MEPRVHIINFTIFPFLAHCTTFGGTPAQTTHQGDLLANIGTITLQQGDQLTSVDLSDLQFASNNLIIKQDTVS